MLVNVPKMMKEKHAKLFAIGLNETHFDLVVGHLVGASSQVVGRCGRPSRRRERRPQGE